MAIYPELGNSAVEFLELVKEFRELTHEIKQSQRQHFIDSVQEKKLELFFSLLKDKAEPSKRQFVRYEMKKKVCIPKKSKCISAVILNASASGCLLQTDEILKSREYVLVEISHPNEKTVIQFPSFIRRIDKKIDKKIDHNDNSLSHSNRYGLSFI